jgi:hypothetical protein
MASYQILSKHVYKGGSVSHSPKISPDKIISGIPLPPTVSSFGHGPWGFYDKGNHIVTITSSGNQYKHDFNGFFHRGPKTQLDDENMGAWIANSTMNPPRANNLIPKMPDTSYIRGVSELGMWLPHEHDTKVNLKVTPRIVEAVDPNRIGFYVSRDANNYDRFKNLLLDRTNRFNEEATEWISFLNKKGYTVGNKPGVLAVGVEKADFVAAYYPTLGYLVTDANFRDKVRVLAARYGLKDDESIEAVERTVLFHELSHVAGVKSERLQGLLQTEFYRGMAARYKGTKKGRMYSAISEWSADYARSHSLSHTIAELMDSKQDSRLEAMVKKFRAEAEALGIDENDVNGYVNSRVMGSMGPLVGGHDYSDGKNLESIAKDAKAVPITSARSYKAKSSKYQKAGKKAEKEESKEANAKGPTSEPSEKAV